MRWTLRLAVVVLVLTLVTVGVADADNGTTEASTSDTTSMALILAPLLAAATAIERCIEGVFGLVEGVILSLGRFLGLGGEYVQWAQEQAKRYRDQLLKMKGDLTQIRAVERQLIDAEQRLKDYLKSEPWVSGKKVVSLVLGILLGVLLALVTKLRMFELLNVKLVPATADMLITGLVIGTGSAPVHSLIGILQNTKNAIDEARALARGRSQQAVMEVVRPLLQAARVEEVPPATSAEEDRLRDLSRGLDEERPERRRLAIGAMGELGGRGIVEPLTRALSDDDEEVRAEATKVLRSTRKKLETQERAQEVESMRLTRHLLS